MNFINNLSLKKKLLFSFLLAGFTPLVIVSFVIWQNNVNSLTAAAEGNLTLIGSSKSEQIEKLFETMSKQVIYQSAHSSTVNAMLDFSNSYQNYNFEYMNRPDSRILKNSLSNYYKNEFGRQYEETNPSRSPESPNSVFSKISATGLAMQYNYISNNSHPLGSKHLLESSNDGTNWSRYHEKYHPQFANFLRKFGYYDVFLIGKSGDIVYSVDKKLDFATNLNSGPYAHTNIAEIYKKIMSATSPDDVKIIDFKKYYPSYEAAAGFIGSPIFKDGQKIGALVFQIPINKINEIMTSKRGWLQSGFEKTGQAFIIGKDRILRSDDRVLLEDQKKFEREIGTLDQAPEDVEYMLTVGTTATALHMHGDMATDAVTGKVGHGEYVDIRHNQVINYFQPLKISGLDWFLVAQKNKSEAFASLYSLIKISGLVALLSIIVLFVVAWAFSTQLSNRLTKVVNKIRSSAESTQSSSSSVRSASEAVSSATTQQAASVQETVATLNEISAMVNKSVEYAKLSAEKSDECLSISNDGKKSVSDVEVAMNEINASNDQITVQVTESNEQISGIVQVINEIAEKTTVINDIVFQTKLLSFNASVEAARAGEHGKGFAVVAEEVGNLAQMSGTAAKEISELIEASIQRVENVVETSGSTFKTLIDTGRVNVERGVLLTKSCMEILDSIVKNTGEVSKMMSEVTGGAQEQAEGVSNITIAMNEIDESTNSNADSAHKSFKFAEELAQNSLDLKAMVFDLEAEVLGQSPQGNHQNIEKNLSQKPVRPIPQKAQMTRKNVLKIHPEKPKRTSQKVTQINHKEKKSAVGQSFEIPQEDDPRFEDI